MQSGERGAAKGRVCYAFCCILFSAVCSAIFNLFVFVAVPLLGLRFVYVVQGALVACLDVVVVVVVVAAGSYTPYDKARET